MSSGIGGSTLLSDPEEAAAKWHTQAVSDPRDRPSAPVEFFFVGPGKTGTSWLYEFLGRHDLVCVPSLKEPYLVDKDRREQERLLRALWSDDRRKADFSNTYSANPENPSRILEHNPAARVIITTRRPSRRIASHYSHEISRGAPDVGLARYLDDGDPMRMVERSDYQQIVDRYLALIPLERVLVLPLEELQHDAESYVRRMSEFLGVPPISLTEEDRAPVRVRAAPRSHVVGRVAGGLSGWLREHGHARALGTLKRSASLDRLVFRSDASHGPALDFGTATRVVERLDAAYPEFVRHYASYALRD